MDNGQASLEFLSTYGFAFLALLLTLGVISYTGIFNLSSLRSNECNFPPGIVCRDYAMSNARSTTISNWANAAPSALPASNPVTGQPYVQLVLYNGYGVDISVAQVGMMLDDYPPMQPCHAVNSSGNGNPWWRNTNRTFYCTVPAGKFFTNTRYDGSIQLNFTQNTGAYTHSIIGTFSVVSQ